MASQASLASHIENGNVGKIQKFLDKKASLLEKAVDDAGNFPLHFAALKDKPDVIKALIKMGANPSSANKEGLLPIHVATMNGSARHGLFLCSSHLDFYFS